MVGAIPGGREQKRTTLVRLGGTPSRKHRFGYHMHPGRWFNDVSADEYVTNEFGSADGARCLRDVLAVGNRFPPLAAPVRADQDSELGMPAV